MYSTNLASKLPNGNLEGPLKPYRSGYVLKTWSSGDFTLACRRSQPKRTHDPSGPLQGILKGYLGQTEFISREGPFVDGALTVNQLQDLWSICEVNGNLEGCIRIADILAKVPEGTPQDKPIKLGLSAVKKSQLRYTARVSRKYKPRGSKGLTPTAARNIRSACKLLEEQYGKSRLALITLTPPALSASEMALLVDKWEAITKCWLTWLKKHLVVDELPTEYVNVTEIQMKRFMATGLIPPHFHTLIVNRHSGSSEWLIKTAEIEAFWKKTLENHLRIEVKIDSAVRCEPIKKSAGKELSKYLSKGAKSIKDILKRKPNAKLPRTWHNISNGLRSKVEEGIKTYTGESVDILANNLSPLKEAGYIKFKTVKRHWSEGFNFGLQEYTTFGYYGWIEDDKADELRHFLDNPNVFNVVIQILKLHHDKARESADLLPIAA